ncbi:MAG: ABC transporter permease [Bacteroidota bacterium]
MIENLLYHIGRYCGMVAGMFRTLERPKVYYELILAEVSSMIGGSMVIVIIISTFIGAVTCLQTAYQLTSGVFPDSIIGSVVSASTLLELSPTVMTFILAGRIGSKIASEIGAMRVTEQIDAIEVMGINPIGYLVLPKIAGGLLALPLLVTVSAFLSHLGGMVSGELSGEVTAVEYTQGIQEYFNPFYITVMYVKAIIFGFIITSVSAYQGFFTHGGSLEVGVSSTRAVVFSCLSMVFADYLIAELML